MQCCFFTSLPDLKLKYVDGTKGYGPEEFSAFPMFCYTPSGNALYIYGGINKRLIDISHIRYPHLEDYLLVYKI